MGIKHAGKQDDEAEREQKAASEHYGILPSGRWF